ncbi:polyprenyl synthetase family protein [Nocardia vinacea]|uniref:polyprenyl synthetase family protein n=1 Tax=Nocardia vinacea TaxID=96468 RepID=UPI003F4DF813
MRPTLTLLSHYLLTDPAVPADERGVRAAAGVELLHLGSLYHDDVIDHADERRGRPSANAVWGSHMAVVIELDILAGRHATLLRRRTTIRRHLMPRPRTPRQYQYPITERSAGQHDSDDRWTPRTDIEAGIASNTPAGSRTPDQTGSKMRRRFLLNLFLILKYKVEGATGLGGVWVLEGRRRPDVRRSIWESLSLAPGQADSESLASPTQPSRSASAIRARRLSWISRMRGRCAGSGQCIGQRRQACSCRVASRRGCRVRWKPFVVLQEQVP